MDLRADPGQLQASSENSEVEGKVGRVLPELVPKSSVITLGPLSLVGETGTSMLSPLETLETDTGSGETGVSVPWDTL